jgi:hypothetical protein
MRLKLIAGGKNARVAQTRVSQSCGGCIGLSWTLSAHVRAAKQAKAAGIEHPLFSVIDDIELLARGPGSGVPLCRFPGKNVLGIYAKRPSAGMRGGQADGLADELLLIGLENQHRG